jgi:type IX secretion system PorP/SprF family membrane protein
MKMKTKKIITLLSITGILATGVLRLDAQDALFTQFYASPLYLSPSYAGTVKKTRLIMNNRIQWAALPRAYMTNSVSVDHNFGKRNFGLGLYIMNDVAGTGRLSETNVGALYSYRLQIGNTVTFRPGIGFYYSFIGNNYLKHTFPDQINMNGPDKPVTEELTRDMTRGYPDASVSLLAHNDVFWAGTSVDHLLRQDKSLFQWDDYVDVKYTVFGGVRIPLRSNYLLNQGKSISPAFVYRRQALFQQLDLCMIWSNRPYMAGVTFRGIPFLRQKMKTYRSVDAFCLHLGYTWQEITMAYTYDLTISHLATATAGAHEFSIIYDLSDYATPKRRKAIPCPRVY